jgi:hypothetical protein
VTPNSRSSRSWALVASRALPLPWQLGSFHGKTLLLLLWVSSQMASSTSCCNHLLASL